jgi:hypothetical protein
LLPSGLVGRRVRGPTTQTDARTGQTYACFVLLAGAVRLATGPRWPGPPSPGDPPTTPAASLSEFGLLEAADSPVRRQKRAAAAPQDASFTSSSNAIGKVCSNYLVEELVRVQRTRANSAFARTRAAHALPLRVSLSAF